MGQQLAWQMALPGLKQTPLEESSLEVSALWHPVETQNDSSIPVGAHVSLWVPPGAWNVPFSPGLVWLSPC